MRDGAYDVWYDEKRYLVRKQTLLDGRLIKFYAEELGGKDFVSLNYYPHVLGGLLKPCEMMPDKVINFVCSAKLFRG